MKIKSKDNIINNRLIDGFSFYVFAIIGVTLLSFQPCFNNLFVSWDDPKYVTENKLITSVSFENLKHIFTVYFDGHYHPLTIISNAIEFHFFGLNPKVFHTTNVILHLFSTLLVFRFIYLLVNKVDIALITSFLFGIHPMRVESVAWISERKDVLYVFFLLISLVYYVSYLNSSNKKYYLLSLLFFIISLFSKGEGVVLSGIIILIDYLKNRTINKKVILEKIPFIILSISFGIIAVFAQKSTIGINYAQLSNVQIFFFAWYGLLVYIIKAFIPVNLCGYYPYPIEVGGAIPFYIYFAFPIIVISAFVLLRKIKTSRTITFGVLFFLGSIFPLLQFIPIGHVLLAERYSYLPYIGIFFLVANGYSFINSTKESKMVRFKPYLKYFSILILLLCVISTRSRCKVWHDSIAFWSDVIKQNPSDTLGYKNRALAYRYAGEYDLSLKDCTKRILLDSTSSDAYNDRGFVLNTIKNYDGALLDLNKAVKLDSTSWYAFSNRAISYYGKNMFQLSVRDNIKALRIDSTQISLYKNLGMIYTDDISDYKIGQYYLLKGLKIDSTNIDLNFNLGLNYYKSHEYSEAIKYFNKIIRLNKDYGKAYLLRSVCLSSEKLKSYKMALEDAIKAKDLGTPVDENYLQQLKDATK